jgi:putative ATP-dependent endonuclease of the OLD family
MYLEAIKVNRYRSIDRLALEPCGDFNVLIGKNSAGKSNILASIDAFFACSSPQIIKLTPPIGELIDFFEKRPVEDISITAKFRLSEEERAALVADMIADHPQLKHVLDGIDPNARLFASKRLLSLKTTRGGPDVLSRIQATVSELLGVKVDAFAGEPGRRGESTAELDVDDFLIQVNGSGIREALRLILDTEFEKPHLLLVEEPEIHLHPALETSIMSYLRTVSQGLQVFVTTHSTNFLDTGNFQNVFLVSKDTSTHVTPLTIAEAQEKLPSELGIRLSSLFMFDQIIFVEGPSDEQIIRELARSLGINFGRLNVGFIQMRGVRNIGHYAAAEVISFLTKRQARLHFLVDGDEANSVHFKRLTEEFGKNAQLHLLQKREIENYLLSPQANIAHLINRKRAAVDVSFQSPSVDSFNAELEICAEALKPLAIWKRVFAQMAHPIYPKDKGQEVPSTPQEMKARMLSVLEQMREAAAGLVLNVEDACTRCAKEVEDEWAKRKLDIVPGATLLDEVYKKSGLRYDKMRDGVALAALVKNTEIDDEIARFLRQL